jgi:hypothetical protein
MAAYQSQAVEPNVIPVAGMRPLSAIEHLPPPDLFIALAAHAGRPDTLTAWLDPSVTDENDPLSVDPALDPFNIANGQPFDNAFQQRYRAAQRDRNHRITDWVLAQLAALDGTRARDRLFSVHRTWADLRMIDPDIEPSDRRPNWCYLGEPGRANYGVFGIGAVSTLPLVHGACARHRRSRAAPAGIKVRRWSHASGHRDSQTAQAVRPLGATDKHLRFIKATTTCSTRPRRGPPPT